MFGRATPPALTVTFGETELEFRKIEELEFALAGRTSLPSAKIARMVGKDDDSLLKEAEAIRAVEKRLTDALSGALDDVTSISPFLKELDLSIISQDHDWRTIVTALNAASEPFEEYKKVALVKYLQYLTARQDVIKSVFRTREESRRQAVQDATAVEPGGDSALKDTLIFDLSDLAPSEADLDDFERIPKGEAIEIPLEPDQRVDVLLAKHRCYIVLKEQPRFIDETGKDSEIRKGKNLVGREVSNDIVINSVLRDVSRKHLIVEHDGGAVVKLTDISSHGTSVHPQYLDRTG